jgi:hypothetical protein
MDMKRLIRCGVSCKIRRITEVKKLVDEYINISARVYNGLRWVNNGLRVSSRIIGVEGP